MSRATAMRIVKPLFGLALLAALATQVELDKLEALMRKGDPRWLIGSLVAFVAALAVFQALRLHVLVRTYTRGLGDSMRLFFIGAFFNNLLPSNVGGDAVRLVYLRNLGGGDWAGPLALLMLHRVSGLIGLAVGFAFYAPFQAGRLAQLARGIELGSGSGRLLWLAVAVLVAASLVGVALWKSARLAPVRARARGFARRFAGALGALSSQALWLLTFYTVCFHGSRMLGFYWAVEFFGQSIGFWDLLPVLAVTAVVALLPLTVGGLGLVEGSLSVGLALFGVLSEAAVGCALIHRLALLLIAAVGGIVYLTQRTALRGQAADDGPA